MDEIESSKKALKRSGRVIDHHSKQLSKAQEKLVQAQKKYSALIDKTKQNTLISRNLGTKKVLRGEVDAAKATRLTIGRVDDEALVRRHERGTLAELRIDRCAEVARRFVSAVDEAGPVQVVAT